MRKSMWICATVLVALGVALPLVAAHVTAIYRTDGGDTMVVASGGKVQVADGGYLYDAATSGTKTLVGTPITIVFSPTTGETLTWTVPDGYDLVVLNAVGWKTAAGGSDAADQWALQNNDGSAANIFDVEELAGVSDKAMCQFDNLDDAENEVESGDVLQLVAGEASDDDGADGIIYVYGILKEAD